MRSRSLIAAGVLVLVAATGSAAGASRGAARGPVTVRMGEFFYKPRLVVVRVGQHLRFVNVGKIEHTVADTDAGWNIRSRFIHPRPLAHGDAQTVTFKRVGTYKYLCTFHPTLMRGRIRVVP